jgi:hypothetical protein
MSLDVGESSPTKLMFPAIGHVTALTWVLEVGEVERFRSIQQVISYCGLCSGERSSAGNSKRTPSKGTGTCKQSCWKLHILLQDSTPSWLHSMSEKLHGATATRLQSLLHASWLPTFWPSIGEIAPS